MSTAIKIIHKAGWLGKNPGTVCLTDDKIAKDLVERDIAEYIETKAPEKPAKNKMVKRPERKKATHKKKSGTTATTPKK